MPEVEGLHIVIENLDKLNSRFRGQVQRNFQRAAEVLHKATVKTASVEDEHTPAWLKAHDFPYAARHGTVQIHRDKPYIVHKQKGDLKKSIHLHTDIKKDSMYWYVWVNESEAPHARFVIVGTKKMVGRNFLVGTLAEKRDQLFDIIRGTARGIGGISPLRQIVIERKY